MDTYSFARKPAPQEHDAVLSFIRHFRRKDILTGIIFAIIGCGLLGAGIYAVIDGFQYAAGFIIASAVVLIISLGCFLSDMDRYKIIKDSKYTVITSMVKDRSCTRTIYHTEYKLRVIYPNNEESVHIVSGFTYRKAKTGMTALIVNYSSYGAEQSKIPVDVVIADSECFRY